MFLKTIPNILSNKLKKEFSGERLKFSQKSDLNKDGKFSDNYLLVYGDKLLVTDNENIIYQQYLKDIKEVKVLELLGGAELIAILSSGEEHVLVRYTKVYTAEFGIYCRVINDLISKRDVAVPDSEGELFCEKCGKPLLERGAACHYCVNVFSVFFRILGLITAYKSRLIILIIATIIAVCAQVGPPYLTKEITDDVIIAGNYPRLFNLILAMITCGFIYFIMRYISTYLASWFSARLTSDLRIRLHDHLQKLRMGYYSKRESGEIVSRVMHDTQELQHFLVDGLPYLFVNTLSFMAIAFVLLLIDWKLALVVFIPVPVLILGVRKIWVKLRALFNKEGSRWGSLHGLLGESIRGLKAVKVAGQEQSRSKSFAQVNNDVFSLTVNIDKNYAAFSEGTYWVMSLAVAIVWWLAAKRIVLGGPSETLTIGDITAFVGYMWMFYGPLQWFTVIANWMNHAFASAERIFSVLDAKTEIYDSDNAVQVNRFNGDIEFKDVRFSYERGKEVIKGINFEIKPGEMIGLVGRSGAGKSTIINLLCRFFDVDHGKITIDGIPIKDIRLHDLRRQIGIVMQEPFLFRATILENIAYGFPDVDFSQVVDVAKAAHAHDFIVSKEFGYDTVIGEGGVSLSGGERQRIAIARALLHNPPILILDEATSSVDSETEKAIQEATQELVKNRTTIAIAHRLATLRNADRLVVMEEGKIAEIGSHSELIERNGIYANLVKTQSELNKLRSETLAIGD